MRTRGKYVVLLGVGVLAGGLVALVVPSGEPAYEGKRLSEWVLSTYGPPTTSSFWFPGGQSNASPSSVSLWLQKTYAAPPAKTALISGASNRVPYMVTFSYPAAMPSETEEAVRHIGTKALPYLVRWLRYEPPGWKERLLRGINKVCGRALKDRSAVRADGAMRAISVLGEKAEAAVPSLALMMNDRKAPSSAGRAMSVLSLLSRELLAADMALMTNGSAEGRLKGVDGLYYVGRDLAPAVPVLVQLLQDGTEAVAVAAAQALGAALLQPKLAVPALANSLEDKRPAVRIAAMKALGRFSRQARAAVPALLALLKDPDPRISNRAADALDTIDPEAAER